MNREFREHQSRSRGTARCRSRLHDFRAGNDRRRRLADECLAHAGSSSLLSAAPIFRRRIVTVSPDFTKVLQRIAASWKEDHAKIAEHGEKIIAALRDAGISRQRKVRPIASDVLDAAFEQLVRTSMMRVKADSVMRQNFRDQRR